MKNKHGQQNVRDRYGTKGRTSTSSKARGEGKGSAQTQSKREGSKNSAKGKKRSIVQSKHLNEDESWGNGFNWGEDKKGGWSVGKNW